MGMGTSGCKAALHATVGLALLLLVAGKAWEPSDFPNPNTDLDKCGRHGVSSRICDPDGVISYSSANVAEGVLKNIINGIPPYVTMECGTYGTTGYEVAVALMNEFKVVGGDPATTVEHFAKQLHTTWGVGRKECNNGVLLLLAIENRQVYISTGAGAKDVLTDSVLDDIIKDMRPLLREKRYGEAVERGVVDLGLALAKRPVKPEGGDDDEAGWSGLAVFVAIVAGIVGWSSWQGYKTRRRFQSCRSKLEKLKADQAAMRAHAYHATSCPICMEDFSTGPVSGLGAGQGDEAPAADDDDSKGEDAPLMGRAAGTPAAGASGSSSGSSTAPPERRPLVLPCGHAFCEPCIGEWLKTKVNCPICRRDIDDEGAAPPPPRPPCSAEEEEEAARQQQAGGASGSGTTTGRSPAPWWRSRSGQQRLRRQQPALLGDELLMAEAAFRIRSLHRLYPAYVTQEMVSTWEDDIAHGRELSASVLRDLQLKDPAHRQALENSGRGGAGGSFGGGSSFGGGGHGGSW